MASKITTSITKQITQTQDKVNVHLYRVDHLEKMLRNVEIPLEKRIQLEDELSEVKKQLITCENELKQRYGENRKTFMFVVLVMFLSFLFYGLYVMIYGPP